MNLFLWSKLDDVYVHAPQEHIDLARRGVIETSVNARKIIDDIQTYLSTCLSVNSVSLDSIAPLSETQLQSAGIIEILRCLDEEKQTTDNAAMRAFSEVAEKEARRLLTPHELSIIEKELLSQQSQ